MTPRRRHPLVAATAVAAAALVAVTACSGDPEPAPTSPDPSAARPGTPRVSMRECQEIPSDGRVYRSGANLVFERGSMLVALPKDRHPRPTTPSAAPTPIPGTPTPPPGPGIPPAPVPPTPVPPTPVPPPNVLPNPAPPQNVPAPVPPPAPGYPPAHHRHHHSGLNGPSGHQAVPVTNAPTAPDAESDECVSFRKWGNRSPEVPPDGLLFTFRGRGNEGGQISFAAVALTGGVLPPLGPVRPTIGPLVTTIPADIGVSLGGKYYLATGCPLKIVAMSSHRAAGHFACPNALPMKENPLGPDDSTPDADDEETPTAAPGQPAPPAPGNPAPPAPGNPAPPAPGHPVPPAQANPDAIPLSGWFEVKP
ncbi:hypothetical protein [Gordonia crocea]|uniref:Lipoprotein n=1 Tax=Gordonia crocea TaxID=589162 RepID=A0A7I9UW32_9ACTN|nr:hypothetical protein [Gordonia crocea]GED97046.1 hypothetical protein nbrc107697_10850 [Gordonia crocea]